jgi:hypothetical protein
VPFLIIDPAVAEDAPDTTIGEPKTSTGDTLASMRLWLMRALLNRDDLSDDEYDLWINDGYLDVCTSVDLDELKGSLSIVTVADQPFYNLPYVVSSTQGASIIDTSLYGGGTPLSKADKAWYREQDNKSGRPETYFREGEVLVLFPTPDKAYTVALDFRIRPLPLTDDTDSPILGQEWHRPIRLSARQKAFDDLQEFDKALPAENSFINSVRRRNNRESSEDEGRVIGSSIPGRGRRRYPNIGRD